MKASFVARGNWKPWLFYAGVALVVMAPLLRPGFILTFDMVFTPHIPAPTASNDYLFYGLLHLLNRVLPADVIQKLMMFFVLFFAGLGMHRLIEPKTKPPRIMRASKFKLDIVRMYGKTKPLFSSKANPAVPAYFGGILYAINPFTYERWMAGHYLLLAGYAVLPWLLRALFAFVNRPDYKKALHLSLLYSLIAMLSIHVLVLAALAGVVAAVVYAVSAPIKWHYSNKALESGAILVLSFMVINSFWLSRVFRGTSPITETIKSFDARHLEAFSTAAHPQAGLLPNVLGMYGFW